MKHFLKKIYRQIVLFVKKRPFLLFFSTLLVFLLLIISSMVLQPTKLQKNVPPSAKVVQVYNIGQTPKATFQAKIDKTGVIKIVSLAGGIVQNIFVNENDSVTAGEQLVTLSSTYQGGNAPALQAQLAQEQYTNDVTTFDKQKDILSKQRTIVTSTHDAFSDMQAIATQSAQDTSSLIDANQVILDQLQQQLSIARNNATTTAELVPLEAQINQSQGGQNQLRQALRNLQEQTDSSKPAGIIADTQRDMVLEQLDVQEKSLELHKEMTRIQADLAVVSAQTMFPASPFAGTVERIYVRIGQQVSPGTPLAEITSDTTHATAVVFVPGMIAKIISKLEDSVMHVGTTSYAIHPSFISSEATDGLLYAVRYPLPDEVDSLVADGSYTPIDVPVGVPDTSGAVPFVPIDAIYQTQDKNYVLLMVGNTATVREVTLGTVVGSLTEITSGLHAGDQVILDRTSIAGDKVTTK